MRTSSAGRRSSRRGVTLLEMLVVAVLIALLASITFPSVAAGVESLRLSSATNSLVSFLDGAMNRAERREEAMEIDIVPHDNVLFMYSSEPGFQRELRMPDGVTIEAVLPAQGLPDAPRRFLLMPGGVPPRIGVALVNRRHQRRIVRVDPITGVPQVEVPETP